jgi:hypothetical protein
MKRVLFATVLLALLLGSFTSAFAAAPEQAEAVLGEVWWFIGNGFLPFERVDMYLYRPDTLAGWPFAVGPNFGTWFAAMPESADRRQSYPTWQYANVWGQYFAEFMLPRDEAWYPCSYPYKWKCNWVWYPGDPINPPVIEWHSPVNQGNFELGLIWPWFDDYVWWLTDDFAAALAAANPQDTVAPLQAKMVGETGFGFVFDFEVTGYYWKWTDLEDDFYYLGLP